MMFLEFVLIFLTSMLFVHLVRHFAQSIGLIDIPNERSAHTNETPRGAGIGFVAAVAVVTPFFFMEMITSYLWVALAIFLVFVVGVLDDHHDTSPNMKFIVIIFATILLFFNDIVIKDLGVFFGLHLQLGWFALPFTVFAVVGFTNALNLIDGLDGLAASVSIVILSSFFLVGYQHEDMFMMTIAGSFIAALLGFLVFNWYPATIFMGDSGSLTLGFVISVLAIRSLDYLPTISILFLASIPIIDTLVVMIRRKMSGRSIFSPDRCHMHHVLRHFFMEDTPKTILFFITMQAIYSITGLQLDKQSDEGSLLILFMLNIVLVYLSVGAMIKRQKRVCH